MRIAHVSDCYLPRLGGIELQVHDLACRQVESGHDVTVFTSTAAHGLSVGELADVPVRVVRSGGGSPERIMYRHTRAGVRRLTRQLADFDAVHVHASSFSPLAFLAAHHASRRGVPTVATVHSLWAKASPLFRIFDGGTSWSHWPVVWSAVSNAAAATLRSILDGRDVVNILPNGVDPSVWQVERVPPSPGELRIVAVSRLAHRKRILELVEILAAARDQLPAGVSISLEVLGEGPQRERIERFVRRHGMADWVRLPGRCTRAEIRSVFARSDLFIAPASLESFGIAALEARCAGLPVLARSGTGVSDFVVHGQEGWLVPSDRAMVETVVSLGRSPETLVAVASHNRSVPPTMSWPSVLERCEALYAEAAERHERVWIRGGADTAGAIDSVQARTGFPTGGDRSVGKRVG